MIGLCKTFLIILAVWMYKQGFWFYCFEWTDLFFFRSHPSLPNQFIHLSLWSISVYFSNSTTKLPCTVCPAHQGDQQGGNPFYGLLTKPCHSAQVSGHRGREQFSTLNNCPIWVSCGPAHTLSWFTSQK